MPYREATEDERKRFTKAAEYAESLSSVRHAELDKKKRRLITRISPEGYTNIGGLSEKALHLTFKLFYEPDINYREVALGAFQADILHNGCAVEIQTGNFGALRKKIGALPEDTSLTVVHPLLAEKRLFRIDPDSGEVTGGRKSPSHEDIYDAFGELVRIRESLLRKELAFVFPVVGADEYRMVCNHYRTHNSVKYECYPRTLFGFWEFDTPYAFAALLPPLPEGEKQYTTASCAKLLGKTRSGAGAFLATLVSLDILKRTKGRGREYLYEYGENY